jgi:molybdopterin-biosynthesis enzyme MoeA-like protein
VPGFPVMAWPMVEWVLDQRFAHLHHQADYVERSVIVWDALEGKLIDLMERITADFRTQHCSACPASVGRMDGAMSSWG